MDHLAVKILIPLGTECALVSWVVLVEANSAWDTKIEEARKRRSISCREVQTIVWGPQDVTSVM